MADEKRPVLRCVYQLTPDICINFDFSGSEQLIAILSRLGEIKPEPCGDCGCTETYYYHFPAKVEGKPPMVGLKCPKCSANLYFATTKADGRKFKQRTNQDGSVRGKNGWEIYRRPVQESNEYSQPANAGDSFSEAGTGSDAIPF